MQITLKAARINANMTQTEAAAAIGVTDKSISNWEIGKNSIKMDALSALAKVYNVAISDIILPNSSQKQ